MRLSGGIKGDIGSFLLRRCAQNKLIRQSHQTGPQYYKRKNFSFRKGIHQLHRRGESPQLQRGNPTQQLEYQRFRDAGVIGEVRRKPSEDYTFGPLASSQDRDTPTFSPFRKVKLRADKALFAWHPRGDLQLFQMGGKQEVFVCYRCGYPVKSSLVAIQKDNWDYRMCYKCYTAVVTHGMENQT